MKQFFFIINFQNENPNTYLETFNHSYSENSSNRATMTPNLPNLQSPPRRLTLANTLGEHTLDLTLSKLLMVKIGHTDKKLHLLQY